MDDIKKTKLIIGTLLGVAVFIVAAQLSQQHSDSLQEITRNAGIIGVLSYIGITMVSIVIAPIGTGFLVPVAANSFGPALAALYSITGWTVGSVIAFLLARYVKRTALQDAAFIEKIRIYEQKLPRWYLYGLIIALRVSLPVDVVSYALGVASTIRLNAFVVTTVIGITPFTFAFTYSAQSELWVQLVVGFVGIIVFLGGILFVKKKLTTVEK